MRPPHSAAEIALSDTAIDFLVRLHSGAPGLEEDARAFTAWRGQSPAHEAAAREAESLWDGLGSAGPKMREERRASRARVTRRTVLGISVLATAGLAAGTAGLLRKGATPDFATAVGQTLDVPLPDGSRALLNASSALALRFTETERSVILMAGQALFTVAPDAARPFVVTAQDGWTRAVGTTFDVDIRPDAVVVTVVEGIVAVGGITGPPEGVMVRADQTLRYDARGRPGAPRPIDAATATAWRRGKLIFDRRPLVEVVAELQRHTATRIVIAGGGLKALEVTGVFDLNDPQSVLETIEQTLPVRVLRLPWIDLIV